MGADGSGLTSNVIEAIDWAIDNQRAWNIKIVNVSLGHPVMESEKDDPLCQAVQRATDAGILVTVAAGQRRQDGGRPAGDRRHLLAGQLAVGADGRRGQHACGRRRGPTT